jgi:hypothetical protein
MVNAGVLKDTYTTFDKWDQVMFEKLLRNTNMFLTPVNALVSVVAPFLSDLQDLLNLYDELIRSWDVRSELEKAQSINFLMHWLLDGTATDSGVWDILDEEQAELVANALPVVLWFALNYASMDYNDTADDDGMWGVGTFVNNMSFIVSNHYQDVSVAWVRSYDDYYSNDLQAYTIDRTKVSAKTPTGTYANATKTLTLSAEEGSSIFYSVDNGASWILYPKPVELDNNPKSILSFSISHGVKSEVGEIPTNPWAGSILGDGNIWFLIIGSAFIVVVCVVGVEINRKRKKATTEN